jgi:hypothetical protein
MTCDIPDLSVAGIKSMLDTGKYSISFFYSDPLGPIPIMVARDIGAGRIATTMIRQQCSLWDNGCPLSDDERPTLGLLFMPKENHQCEILVNGIECLIDWFSVRSIMEEVIKEETGQSTIELFYKACISDALLIKNKLKDHIKLSEAETMALEIIDNCGVIAILLND